MRNDKDPAVALLQRVLRLSPEPFEYFTELDVHRALTEDPSGYFRFIKTGLADIAAGRVSLELPPKEIFQDNASGGDYRVMPCVVRKEGRAVKTVKIIGTNTQQLVVPDQITVGKAFAVHPSDNFVSHIFEACLLSSARTGICASLAVDLLAEKPNKISIIGGGRVGYYAALYVCAIAGATEIEICDLAGERAETTAAQLSLDVPNVIFSSTSFPHPATADVVILATTSKDAILAPPDTSASLVISLGADTDDQHELHQDWATSAKIFVDTIDSARYGDLRQWQHNNAISPDDLTDLFTLLRQPAMKSTHQRRAFISTGSALFDNLTIAYILEQKGQPGLF